MAVVLVRDNMNLLLSSIKKLKSPSVFCCFSLSINVSTYVGDHNNSDSRKVKVVIVTIVIVTLAKVAVVTVVTVTVVIVTEVIVTVAKLTVAIVMVIIVIV